MPTDDLSTANWQIIPNRGIGPIALRQTWDQVAAILPGGPPKPDEFPDSLYFDAYDLRVTFDASETVDWIDMGGASRSAFFGDFDVFAVPYRTLVTFIRTQDAGLFQNPGTGAIASAKLGFVAWSNDGVNVASVVICDPAAYRASFGKTL